MENNFSLTSCNVTLSILKKMCLASYAKCTHTFMFWSDTHLRRNKKTMRKDHQRGEPVFREMETGFTAREILTAGELYRSLTRREAI